MKTRHIRKYCKLMGDAQRLFETAMQKLGLSARAYARILKLLRTIADPGIIRRYLVTPYLRGNTIQDPGQGSVLGGP